MRPVPYIGVTGFMHASEVHAALAAMDDCGSATDRKLMVGVLASSKSLAGVKTKWPNRYPDPASISGLFQRHPRALNLIHYATDDKATLGKQLERLVSLGGPLLEGFQLNIAWPEPAELEDVAHLRIVLQLGGKALLEAGNNPVAVATSLDEYEGLITDVLLDASGGRGLPMDTRDMLRYVHTIARAHPRLGIGIAGGLRASTIRIIDPVIEHYPFISIDGEGRLRTDDDHMDIPEVQAYLHTACRTFG